MDIKLLKEDKSHGDYYFPLRVSSMLMPPTNNDPFELFHLHWHDELEFLHVIEGKLLLRIGISNIEVLAGQAIFINSGELHIGFCTENLKCKFFATVFDIDFIGSKNYDIIQSEFINSIQKMLSPFILIKGTNFWEQEILIQLTKIESEYEYKRMGFQFKIKACLYNILYEIFTNTIFEDNPDRYLFNKKTDKIKKVLEHIHTYYYLKLDCGTLANLLNLSEDHFRRFFKSLLEKTPVEYINQHRINIAANLLINGNDKIIEIAMKTGFDNISYFIKVFKNYTKYSPRAYRKKHQIND
jgi:AraC-like DNA-binding protein